MRYISEDRLKKIAEGHTGKLKWLLECLVSECKELPQQQWKTIAEFLDNPINGTCFIKLNGFTHKANYKNNKFYDTEGYEFKTDAVDCVTIPIQTQQQWQTIEEFKANPVDGLCWVSDPNGNVISACYKSNGKFYDSHISDYYVNINTIWYVMPIKTPEAPK